ncbi:MAG: gamma-glutamyltransferase [Pedosphaera sp.]|nr:gamma-glutamyltransferase [Pedosphaera sp.]
MNPCLRILSSIAAFALATVSGVTPANAEDSAVFKHGMVATIHPLATDSGITALRAGGNAIDAAIACALTLGVVDGQNSGIGGGCFFLIRRADGSCIAIDGRETAPMTVGKNLYIRDGRAVAELSLHGSLSVGVPGELAALAIASTRFGRLPLAVHLENAASLADRGFPLGKSYAGCLATAARELAALTNAAGGRPLAGNSEFSEFRRLFLPLNRSDPQPETWLQQPDLSHTYREIAAKGPDWFYRGPFASRASECLRQSGGLLTRGDFSGYEAKLREPLRTTYRGCELIGFPPPSSGGVHVAEILNILETFNLPSMDPNSADFIHLVTEAMKLAFADRAHWLGDPDFAKVPRALISKEYARHLGQKIRMDRATPVPKHGNPAHAGSEWFGKHTTHFSTADSDGNWVACTATVNTTFGSKVVVPGTGVVLNNQMDDFAAQPDVPNAFGLVGAKANAIAPGKRPLSSMSPTVVLRNGQPILAVGAAGGPTIISQTLLPILRTVDFRQNPSNALAGVRFHHQWKPDSLLIEKRAGEVILEALRQRGHTLVVVDDLGATQAVGWNATDGEFTGAADPRSEGSAKGW